MLNTQVIYRGFIMFLVVRTYARRVKFPRQLARLA